MKYKKHTFKHYDEDDDDLIHKKKRHKIERGEPRSKLNRRRKRDDGGNVTETSKTPGGPGAINPNGEPRGGFLDRFNRARDQGPLDQIGTWGVRPSYEWHDEARRSGPKAQDRLSSRNKGGHVKRQGRGR